MNAMSDLEKLLARTETLLARLETLLPALRKAISQIVELLSSNGIGHVVNRQTPSAVLAWKDAAAAGNSCGFVLDALW